MSNYKERKQRSKQVAAEIEDVFLGMCQKCRLAAFTRKMLRTLPWMLQLLPQFPRLSLLRVVADCLRVCCPFLCGRGEQEPTHGSCGEARK